MNIYSKARLVFFVIFVYATLFFVSYFLIQKNEHLSFATQRYKQVALYLDERLKRHTNYTISVVRNCSGIQTYTQRLKMSILHNEKRMQLIAKKGRTLIKDSINHSINYRAVGLHGRFYLCFQLKDGALWIEDRMTAYFVYTVAIGYLVFLLSLILLYWWFMRSIVPLRILRKEVEAIRDGNLSITTQLSRDGEVGIIANVLNDALRRVEEMVQARQMLLRSVMHELNTPIAKGKLLNALLDDKQQKEGYEKIFSRLEVLVRELAQIEQILIGDHRIKMEKLFVVDVIEQAIELLMISDDDRKHVRYDHESIIQTTADFDLLALAVKNLVDNALKYSEDGKVTIRFDAKQITLCSKGHHAIGSLDEYRQPFSYKANGMGLGLYIVHSVAKMIQMDFAYSWANEKNCFHLIRLH